MQQRHTAGQAPEPSTRETVVRGGVFTPTGETIGVKCRAMWLSQAGREDSHIVKMTNFSRVGAK